MQIQFIDKKEHTFRLMINNIPCELFKKDLWTKNNLLPKKAVAKGSTYGWNLGKNFVSYKQIKKVIYEQKFA